MVTLPFIDAKFDKVFHEARHKTLGHRRGVLHRWALIDLEQPELAVDVWEEVKAVDTDTTLAPFDQVPR